MTICSSTGAAHEAAQRGSRARSRAGDIRRLIGRSPDDEIDVDARLASDPRDREPTMLDRQCGWAEELADAVRLGE